jgi:hypothetical protein
MPLPETDLDPEERDRIIDRIAQEVVKRRLETPAILFLEMHRPLQFLSSQALVVFSPLLAVAFSVPNLEKLSLLMEKRENLDRLLDRIEALVGQRDGKRELASDGVLE